MTRNLLSYELKDKKKHRYDKLIKGGSNYLPRPYIWIVFAYAVLPILNYACLTCTHDVLTVTVPSVTDQNCDGISLDHT